MKNEEKRKQGDLFEIVKNDKVLLIYVMAECLIHQA